ncbi:MAG: AbrB/MazE/SpoVT family DNA-binding domain-containing protein [Candidatus Omnitrophica bacterium]|nr:AbrB/MazE/SpoVT family DNA-binding domain-containing protein [Candidatus Omnitrophota bacterium]
MTTRIRGKGQVTIPASVRAALKLSENDLLSIARVGNAVLLYPQPSVFESVASKFSQEARRKSITLEMLLKDLRQARRKSR